MATFIDYMKAEIEKKKAEIVALEAHLASGEGWLTMEADLIWHKVKDFFAMPKG